MTLAEYQELAARFRGDMPASLGSALGVMWTLGLCGEAGEVAEKVKKLHRDSDWLNVDRVEFRAALTKEMGDVLWYLSQLARDFGISMDDVAAANLAKLADRQQRQKLSGSGDNR